MPLKHNVTLFVNNTTQSRRVVKQLKNVIDDPFSRTFRTIKGDALKAYVVPDDYVEKLKEINAIGDLSLCEADGLITPLDETGQETNAEGATLHHFKYVVPAVYIESDYARLQLELLAKRLSYPAFLKFAQPIFGNDISNKNYQQLHKELLEGLIQSPEIVVDASKLKGHQAAYNRSDKKIYLDEQVINKALNNQDETKLKLLTILIEEFGHYIDDRLRNEYSDKIGGDAKNDEGAVFAYQIGHQNIFASDLINVAKIQSVKFTGDLTIDISQLRSEYLSYVDQYEQQSDEQFGNYEFFGAGFGNLHDPRSHGHRSIELVLDDVGFNRRTELPVIYFGNWLRDFSQVIDPSLVRPSQEAYDNMKSKYGDNKYLAKIKEENGFKLSREALTKLVGLLAVQTFKNDDADMALDFKRRLWGPEGQTLLGCYRPEEHIDNPIPGVLSNHENWTNYQELDESFAPPPTLKQLEINPTTLLKNYIATDLGGDQSFPPASDYMVKKLKQAMDDGRTTEGLIAFGEALHVLEDFFSHSNFIELALIELGYDQVYPWVAESEKINGKYPLVTGGFGSTDMLHSIAPKLHAMIPNEIKPYDSPDLKNVAGPGEEPRWRSPDDELLIVI